jgi:hypothetical protein
VSSPSHHRHPSIADLEVLLIGGVWNGYQIVVWGRVLPATLFIAEPGALNTNGQPYPHGPRMGPPGSLEYELVDPDGEAPVYRFVESAAQVAA